MNLTPIANAILSVCDNRDDVIKLSLLKNPIITGSEGTIRTLTFEDGSSFTIELN